MTRRDFLVAAAVVPAAAARRPNIVLLMTDQQTHHALSAAGNPWLKTPAMDSLAALGVRFTECHTPFPLCSPARSSIFTGRMPHETGVRTNGLAIAPGIRNMGAIFRESGYDTLYAGKWHLPRNDDTPGFTRLAGGSGQGGVRDEPAATACIEWLRRRKSVQPFLMVASFINPHDICEWIRQHKGRRELEKGILYPPAPANMAADPNEPEWVQHHRTGGIDLMSEGVGIASEWRRDEWRYYLEGYYRLVEKVDAQIGRVLAAMRETGLDRDTVVAFTADHGEGMGAHRWVQKACFYEDVIKVPLIVAGAAIARRGVVERDNLVSTLDLVPTFCDLAGVPAPKPMTGISLRPALEGATLPRTFVVSELRFSGEQLREGRMVRTKRYKYIAFNGGVRPEQLFDLELDPGETLNLAGHADHRAPLDEHRRLLAGWIAETKDDFRAS